MAQKWQEAIDLTFYWPKCYLKLICVDRLNCGRVTLKIILKRKCRLMFGWSWRLRVMVSKDRNLCFQFVYTDFIKSTTKNQLNSFDKARLCELWSTLSTFTESFPICSIRRSGLRLFTQLSLAIKPQSWLHLVTLLIACISRSYGVIGNWLCQTMVSNGGLRNVFTKQRREVVFTNSEVCFVQEPL